MGSIPSGFNEVADFFDKYSTLFGLAQHPEGSLTDMVEKIFKESLFKNGIWNDTPVELEYQTHWVNIFNTSKVEV